MKAKRNAIKVSIKNLRELANSLEEEGTRNFGIIGTKEELLNQKWDIPIINKTGMSDDWEFEKTNE